MFKTFRNKVFAIYMISIILLLVGSLTFVYVRSVNEMESSIEQRLMGSQGPKDDGGQGGVKPDDDQMALMMSEQSEMFNVDEARDIVIYQNEDLEQKVSEYLGDQYYINYQDGTIISGDDTYRFQENDGIYKVVKVTYDLEYIDNLQTTLLMFGTLVLILFGVFGFILITNLVKPLAESYEIQNRFVSDASHELKTPLAIIKSCLQLIAKDDDDKENLLVYCQDETDRLIRLTSNLLQLSETQSPKYELINVSQTIDILISGLEVGLFEKKIKLTSEIAEDVKAKMASDDINQLVHILVDNAVKYNDDRRKVKVSLKTQNRSMYLQVKNSSELIDEKHLEHLFDRFYRIDSARTEKGFGLGLALAKHLVEKYNGEIKAEYEGGYFIINVKFPIS